MALLVNWSIEFVLVFRLAWHRYQYHAYFFLSLFLQRADLGLGGISITYQREQV